MRITAEMNGAEKPARISKGERTRRRVVHEAAKLFNASGYAGTSLADVLAATGLEKGGLYNHFPGGKDELAVAAFDYAWTSVARARSQSLSCAGTASSKLTAMIDAFATPPKSFKLGGGCPLFNTAIEVDDDPGAPPRLRERARTALREWERAIERVVTEGLRRGEIRTGTEPRTVAAVLTAALEGGLAFARLYRDRRHLERVGAYLRSYVASLDAQP